MEPCIKVDFNRNLNKYVLNTKTEKGETLDYLYIEDVEDKALELTGVTIYFNPNKQLFEIPAENQFNL